MEKDRHKYSFSCCLKAWAIIAGVIDKKEMVHKEFPLETIGRKVLSRHVYELPCPLVVLLNDWSSMEKM